jgi:hypothetical protein
MSLEELESYFRVLYTRTPANQDPVLPVQDQLLAQYVSNNGQRNLLARPGRTMAFTYGRVNAQQIHSKRPSYINALLIQSRGVDCAQPCVRCRTSQGRTPFPECRRVPDAFGGCCANCKWPDLGSRCSLRGQPAQVVQRAIGAGVPGGIQGHHPGLINLDPEEGDTGGNPINLDPDKGGEGNPIVL